jgi:uncharacterized protein DUF4062
MAGAAPAVLVSSTFYDLRQIRADLKHFLADSLGYRALLSEDPSFPINPDLTAIENCRRRVERDADILVLVIGGRYGSIDDHSAKSVTNLEYLSARVKGIPVFAFVDKSVLTLYEVWTRDPEARLGGLVDTPLLFEFIKTVRTTDAVWTIGFETAQDITGALRHQFAFLLSEGLELLRRTRGSALDDFQGLNARAFRLALEKPRGWEHKLFAEVLVQAVAEAGELRAAHRMGIAFGVGSSIEGVEGIRWMLDRGRDFVRLADACAPLSQALDEALGPPGLPGDAQSLILVARQMGSLYRAVLEVSEELRRAHYDDPLLEGSKILARLGDDMVDKLERAGPMIVAGIDRALAAPDQPVMVDINMKIGGDMDRFKQMMNEAIAIYKG